MLAETTLEQTGRDGFDSYLSRFLRRLAAGTAAGLVAAFVAGGVGGRIMMRLLALTSKPEVAGAFTDDGEVVGRITMGGTLALVLFVTLFFWVGGVLYLLVRRWLPWSGWRRGLAFGTVLTALALVAFLDPDARDVTILGPHPLPILLAFVAIPVGYGLLVAPLADRLEHFYATVELRSPAGLAFLVLLPTVMPLVVLPALVALGAGWAIDGNRGLRRGWAAPAVDRAGSVLLAALVAAGLLVGGAKALDIEPRPATPADFVEPDF
jgi:hypothetical protein